LAAFKHYECQVSHIRRRRAFEQYGRQEIFNSDQGTQFTTLEYFNLMSSNNVKISLDGKERCIDNIFIERLWRTIKYEEVYIKSYET
jgi:putative transposase